MGFLKKVSNTLFGSSGPKYNQDKAAMTSQYGVQSSIGNMNIIKIFQVLKERIILFAFKIHIFV